MEKVLQVMKIDYFFVDNIFKIIYSYRPASVHIEFVIRNQLLKKHLLSLSRLSFL